MPNFDNVIQPVSLVGLGRSGTTLLQAAFAQLPQFQVCGETLGMIAALWSGATTSYLNNDFLSQQRIQLHHEEKPPHYIRACLCTICPSRKREWFHRPIGLPKFLNWESLPGWKSKVTRFPVQWYWDVLTQAFPLARYFTIVRSPWDVALSRREHSGWDLQSMLHDIAVTYELYEASGDRIRHVAFFDELVQHPAPTLKQVCDAVEVEFSPKMLTAFERFHAPVPGRSPKREHRESWNDFNGLQLESTMLEKILMFWRQYGRELEVPSGLVVY